MQNNLGYNEVFNCGTSNSGDREKGSHLTYPSNIIMSYTGLMVILIKSSMT